MHATLEKFGYPRTCLLQVGPWIVMLRPRQPTFASVVIVHSSDAVRAVGSVPSADFAQFAEICTKIESAISNRFGADRFNYMAFMMVDPHVHFHVCPRYSREVNHGGTVFVDPYWPKPVDISGHVPMSETQFEMLLATLQKAFSN